MIFMFTLFKLAKSGDLETADIISLNSKRDIVETLRLKSLSELKFCRFIQIQFINYTKSIIVFFLIFEVFHSTIVLIRKHLEHTGSLFWRTTKSGIGLMLARILKIRNFYFVDAFSSKHFAFVFLMLITANFFYSRLH